MKNNEFGRWLREQREKRDLSVQDLVEKAGISHVSIRKIENGHTKPRPGTRRKLRAAIQSVPLPYGVSEAVA